MEDIIFFFGADNYLSNWHPAKFILTFNNDDYNFENVEQAMMASKAMLFNDLESFQKILKTPNPKSVKALGRKVKNFDPKLWDEHKKYIVKTAVLGKFLYNDKLKENLLATGNKFLAEDSPYDKIWGIGTKSMTHKKNKTWPGQNLLGEILMEVREELSNK